MSKPATIEISDTERAWWTILKRDVWTVAPANYKEAHFATFPPALITPCILAGCPIGGTVLDPFGGSGTTGQVALETGQPCFGIRGKIYLPTIKTHMKKTTIKNLNLNHTTINEDIAIANCIDSCSEAIEVAEIVKRLDAELTVALEKIQLMKEKYE